MEVEEMKTLWAEMSAAVEKQKKLTDSIIIKMTQADYRNKITKIQLPEAIGSFICLLWAVFILVNFQKLNTWYLVVCGVVSILIFLVLSVFSFRAIHNLRSVNIAENNYKQSLEAYAKAKLQFVFVQKLNFYLGSLLIVVFLPVAGALFGAKDFFKDSALWFSYIIMFPFFYYFSTWVFKKYIRVTADAENILKEMDN